eukprot:1479974-Pyramimonas_sp.AAC.1
MSPKRYKFIQCTFPACDEALYRQTRNSKPRLVGQVIHFKSPWLPWYNDRKFRASNDRLPRAARTSRGINVPRYTPAG